MPETTATAALPGNGQSLTPPGVASPAPAAVTQACIAACHLCHDTCLRLALTSCLELGGAHVRPEHLRLLLNCAELCRTTAHFVATDSSLYAQVCGLCANVCHACARSCDEVGQMEACAEVCAQCERECRRLSATQDREAAAG